MTQGGTLPAKKGGVKRHVSGRVYTCIIAFPQFTCYFEMPSTQFLRICEALFEKNSPAADARRTRRIRPIRYSFRELQEDSVIIHPVNCGFLLRKALVSLVKFNDYHIHQLIQPMLELVFLFNPSTILWVSNRLRIWYQLPLRIEYAHAHPFLHVHANLPYLNAEGQYVNE